jgi:GNAT superfamily N-acetyltransferase
VDTLNDIALRKIYEVEQGALEGFTCGREELDQFLTQEAHNYSEHGLTETVVAFAGSDTNPAAYFSLSADGLKLESSEQFELGLPFDCPILYLPAVKITKLAVRQDVQSNGLGATLIKVIEGLAFNGSVAVRLLTVDAVNNPKAIAFYQQHGFKTSMRHEIRQKKVKKNKRGEQAPPADEPETVLMYRDLYAPEEKTPPASLWPKVQPDQILPNEEAGPAA